MVRKIAIMGSTGIYSKLNHADFFKEEIVPRFIQSEQEIIKYAHIGKIPLNDELESSEIYLAVRNLEGRIYASVIELTTLERAPNKNEVIYRITDEDFGPHNYDCPIDILSILSPLDCCDANKFALKWRENQRVNKKTNFNASR